MTLIKKVIRMSNNVYAALITFAIAYIIAPRDLRGFYAAGVVFAYTAGGNTLNEYFDRKTTLDKNMVLKYALFFFSTGSVLLFLLPLSATIVAIAVALMLLYYDTQFIHVQQRLNLKNAIVAVCTAFVPIFAVVSVERYQYLLHATAVSFIFLAWQFYRERWKDIDERGKSNGGN